MTENIRYCNISKKMAAAGIRKGRGEVRNLFAGGLSVAYNIQPENIIAWISSDQGDFKKENVHRRFVLKTITRGCIRTMLDGYPLILHPGDAVLFFPYQVHISSLYEKSNSAYEMAAVTFTLAEGCNSAVLEPLRGRVFRMTEEDGTSLVRILRAYQGIGKTTASDAVRELTGILQRKLSRLGDSVTTERVDLSGRMAEVCTYIRLNLKERISVKTIAAEFGVSRETVRRDFRKYFGGLSPSEMMRTLRMGYASERLSRTEKSVAEIAEECGFSNPFVFSAAFKNYYGMPPVQYRKQYFSKS